ncbi:MAG TPA: TIGR00341 family protein [Rhodothermales bacterium]|nr:TIGR00341 family protein [Rhodothermales bacterium]
MALRQVDVYLPPDRVEPPHLEAHNDVLGCWMVELEDGQHLLRVLLDTGDTEALITWLDEEIGLENECRVVLSSVEATVPHPPDKSETPEESAAKKAPLARVSRDELYQDVIDAIDVSKIFHIFVFLSTVVAAGGMLRNNVAVVIGAMVIAPLLGPNIALALGTTLGDTSLLRRALWVNITGVILALVLSVLIGLLFTIDPTTPELFARTRVHLSDIVLALAAGAAGALSFTRGMAESLIGVMVAVALLPPLVALGILMGAGYWLAATGALLLVLTNVVCVNLSAVTTFFIQGIRPMRWYEEARAKKATRLAIALWVGLLIVLAIVITLAPKDMGTSF